MVETPRALARWRAHLEEVIGVEDAAAVVDPFASIDWSDLDQRVTLLHHRVDQLEDRFDQLEDRFDRFAAEMRDDVKDLRRDLLRVTGAQFFALAAAVAALVGLG